MKMFRQKSVQVKVTHKESSPTRTPNANKVIYDKIIYKNYNKKI